MGPQTLYSTLIVTRIDPFKGNPILIIRAPILLISAAECPIPASNFPGLCPFSAWGQQAAGIEKRDEPRSLTSNLYIYIWAAFKLIP